MKKNQLALSIMVATTMSGCASINQAYVAIPEDTQAFVGNKPAELQPFLRTMFEEGERNAVLNQDRLGLAAIETKNYDVAAHALDNAISGIDAIYSDNAAAEDARSKFNEEKVKDFKGEAYERAMTYYYRGLLYLRTGEYDNARAAFLGASLQDKFSEDQTYNQDIAVMDYLAGWASMCMGDKSAAEDHLRRATTINPGLAPLTTNPPKHLAIMETGYAPIKVLSGKYSEILQFTDNAANLKTHPHLFMADTETGNPILASDLLFQATTRGGRVVDSINAGKAEFKENSENLAMVGAGVAVASAVMSSYIPFSGYISLGSSVVSMVSGGVASATTPAADARRWEGLPKQIYLASIDTPPTDPSTLTMKLDTAAPGVSLYTSGVSIPFPMQAQNGGCGFSWTHAPSAKHLVPMTQLIEADTDDDRGPKNLAYRNQLKTQF
jgi:hypothetical protein